MKALVLNRFMAPLLIRPVLLLHNIAYKLAGRLSIILNGGEHPKTEIINYVQWFQDQVGQQDTILDVGSHKGSMARELASKCKQVFGIEIDKKLYEQGLKWANPENVSFFCADATKFDYSTIGCVDKVTMSNVLEHIEHRTEFLKQLSKSVIWGEGGVCFLIRVPLIERDWISVYKKNLGVDYRLDPTHYTEYTLEEFEREIAESGLKIKNYKIKFGEIFAVCI